MTHPERMYKNILVPLDGSPASEAALPYARSLAGRAKAQITLVRVAHASPTFGDRGMAQLSAISTADDYLASVATELTARGFEVQTGSPYGGSSADWILEEARMHHADLIVMATHDRIGPDRWLHGSVAEAIVGQASVPVLLVRATDTLSTGQPFVEAQPVLLVPLDGSTLAEAALTVACRVALALDGRIILLDVVPWPGALLATQDGAMSYTDVDRDQLESDADAYLKTVVTRLSAVGVCVEPAVRTGQAAHEIAAAAFDYRAALVVMATHGRTGAVRSILGSVAGDVVHLSSSPVMLVRPPLPLTSDEPVSEQARLMAVGV